MIFFDYIFEDTDQKWKVSIVTNFFSSCTYTFWPVFRGSGSDPHFFADPHPDLRKKSDLDVRAQIRHTGIYKIFM